MSDPKPIEYELDDGHDKPAPQTDAEMAAAAAREEEERAKRMGLVKERHAPASRRWQDGIGGNSALGAAARLQEQEARLAKLKADAARERTKTVAVSVALVAALIAVLVVAADYTGIYRVGIFAPPPMAEPGVPPASTIPAVAIARAEEVAKPQPSREYTPGEVIDMTPVNRPAPAPAPVDDTATVKPIIDDAKLARAEEKIATAQRGIAAIQKDIAEIERRLLSHLKAQYGVAMGDLHEDPERIAWRAPCAMLELQSADAAPRPLNGAASIRLSNAQATVNNLTAYIAKDRKLLVDVTDRLKKPRADLQAAEAMKAEALGSASTR